MDLDAALDALPEVHSRAIRLQRAGAGPTEIASELDIEFEAVAPLLRVAQAKLASLLSAPDPPREGTPDG